MDDLSEPFGDGLPVKLIATPRDDLTVCGMDENVETVRSRNIDDYDHIPVLDHHGIIIGSLSTKNDGPGDHLVAEAMDRLNGRLICGESSSIVDFIEGIRTQTYCFTVGSKGISGLDTWSDIQKLPARAALFARVTQLDVLP